MAKWLRKWRRGWCFVRSNTKNAKSLICLIPYCFYRSQLEFVANITLFLLQQVLSKMLVSCPSPTDIKGAIYAECFPLINFKPWYTKIHFYFLLFLEGSAWVCCQLHHPSPLHDAASEELVSCPSSQTCLLPQFYLSLFLKSNLKINKIGNGCLIFDGAFIFLIFGGCVLLRFSKIGIWEFKFSRKLSRKHKFALKSPQIRSHGPYS